jgi:hypothetical protein
MLRPHHPACLLRLPRFIVHLFRAPIAGASTLTPGAWPCLVAACLCGLPRQGCGRLPVHTIAYSPVNVPQGAHGLCVALCRRPLPTAVEMARLERAIPAPQTRCVSQLRYISMSRPLGPPASSRPALPARQHSECRRSQKHSLRAAGAMKRSRTSALRLRRPALCPPELPPHGVYSLSALRRPDARCSDTASRVRSRQWASRKRDPPTASRLQGARSTNRAVSACGTGGGE